MRRRAFAPTAVLLASAAALAAGCGSVTKTVSVSGTPPPSQSGAGAATTTTGSTATAPQHAATSPAATAPSATRTAPAPAFTQYGATGAGGAGQAVSGAEAVVRAKGFTASNASEYHPGQTLQVLVGTRTGSGDGYGQQAFFFVDGRYIGTDATQPSATVHVVSQGDTEVVLAYPLYRSGDPLSHPSGGQTTVRFQLNDGQLVPLGKIPPVSSQGGFSRQ